MNEHDERLNGTAWRILAVVLGAAGLALALALSWQPAQAAGVVTDCSSDAQLRSVLKGGGAVFFNCGGNGSSATIVVNPQLVVTSSTSLDGGGKVTLSGANTNRVLNVDAGIFGPALTFTLTHITLTNGYAGAGNGGCLGAGFAARIVLDDVTVQNCRTDSAGYGGGIDSGLANQLLVLGSRVLNNEAGEGGGIRGIGIITFSQTLVAYNHAITGGGLALRAAVATIADSTFYSNTATGDGGGMYLWPQTQTTIVGALIASNVASGTTSRGGGIYNAGTATLYNSTLSDNVAYNGGGIYNQGTETLSTSSLSGNHAGSDGGGIYNNSVTTLSNATLTGNTATYGGGLYNNSTATLSNTTLSGNTATWGGGIENFIGATVNVNNTTLSGNTAALNGGGVDNYSTVIINYSTLGGNTATNGGGLNNNSTATLSNTTLSGNTATDGGSIYNYSGARVNINNSTLSGNTATYGGGIENLGLATLRNATMSNNSATQGGALYMQSGHATVLTNTIVAYSPGGGNCFGTLTVSKFTFSSDNSCALAPGNTIKGQNPNGLDPLFTALGNYGGPTLVHMPKTASPAIAGIVGNDAPLTDQRGQPRPGPDGSYDIGAVERQPGDSDLAPRLYLPLIRR